MKKERGMKERIRLRAVTRNRHGHLVTIKEQSIPATPHQVGLFLRRAPFRDQIADAVLIGCNVTIEPVK
jgi:hypothetical protein